MSPDSSTASRGSRPRASARLAAIIVRRGSQRSTNTPASDPSAICGTNDARSVNEDATVDRVRTYT
jgi:hypothetical protein